MRKALLFSLVVLAALLWFGFSFVVQETEYAIVLRLGNPVRVIDEAGLYSRYPGPIDRIVKVDRRIQVFDPSLPADDVEYLTSDKHNVVLHGFLAWRVADPRQFYKSVGDVRGAEFRLSDMMRAQVGTTVSSFPFSVLASVREVVSKEDTAGTLEEITDEITDKLAAAAKGSLGIDILAFKIKRLTLPGVNKNATYQRMEAERRSVTDRIRSEGDEQANEIRVQAELERSRILNEATLESERIRGDADAEANRIYAEAYGIDPEFYLLYESLNALRAIFGKEDQLVVPADHPLLKVLQQEPLRAAQSPDQDGQ